MSVNSIVIPPVCQNPLLVYSDRLTNFEEISKLNVGSAVVVKGVIVATPEAKQPFAF